MTAFETFLINKGYIRFYRDFKSKKYSQQKTYGFSSLDVLNYEYIPANGKMYKALVENNFDVFFEYSSEEKQEIVYFGLNERDKAPTLIYPRPRIEREL